MAEALQKVHNTLSQMQKNLECSICLELLQDPVLTKCEHHFCNFCILSLLQSKQKGSAPCPLCKEAVTKRGLIKHDSLKNIVNAYRNMVTAVEGDTGRKCTPPRGPVRFSQPEPPSQRPKRMPKKAAKKSNVRRGKTKGQPVMPIYLDEEEENEILGQSAVFKSNTNVRSSFPSSKETGKKSENKLPEDDGIENGVSVTSHVDQPMIIEVLASESLGEVTEGPDRTSSEKEQKDNDKGMVKDEQPNSRGSPSLNDPYEFIASQRTPRKIKVRHVKEKKKKPWEYSFGKIGRKKKVVQAGGTQCYEVSQSDDDEENDSSLIHREDIDYFEEGEQVSTAEQTGILNDVRREGIIESKTEKAGENGRMVCEVNGVKDDDEDDEMGDGQVEVVEVQEEEEVFKNNSNCKRISTRDKRTLLSTQLAGEGKAKRRSRDAAMKALDAIKGQSHSQSSGESSRSCIGTASFEASPLANANGGNSRLVMLQESQECYEKRTEEPLDVRPASPEGGRQEMPLSQPPKLNRNHGDRLFATAYGKGKNRSPPQKESESRKLGEDLLLDDLPDLLNDADEDGEDERYGNEEVGPGDVGLLADVEDEHTIDMEEVVGRKTSDVIDLTDDGDEVTVEKEQSRDGAVENNEDTAEQVEKPVKIPQESDSFVAEETIKSVPEVQNQSRSEISEINHSKTSTKESSPNNETGQEGQNGGGIEDGYGSVIGSGKKRQTLKERMKNKEGLTASDIIDNPEQDHQEHLQSDWEFALKLAQELGSVPSNLKVSEKDLRSTEGRGRVRRMAQLKIQNGPEESEKKKRRKRNGGKCGQTSKERADTDVEIDSFNGDSKNDDGVGRVASLGQRHQQGRKGKGRRLVNEERIQSVPETPVVKSKLIEKTLVMDQDGDEECIVEPPEDDKGGKTVTKDGCFERGDEKRNVELDVEMVEGSNKVKAGRKGKTRGRKMNSEEKHAMEGKEDDVIEIVDEEKQEGYERREDLETTVGISDKNERRKSTRLCKDNEMGKDTPSEKTKHTKKKGKERGSFLDEMSATLKNVKDAESIKDLGDELIRNGANDRKGNETKKSRLDVAVEDEQREEVQMKELKDHVSKGGKERRRRSSRLSKSQERVTGNSERKAASQCEANKDRNITTPGVVDEQGKGQIKSTRLSKSQEYTQEKTKIAGRKRKLSQEPECIDVDVQLVGFEEDRQEVSESQKTKRRSSRLSKSQEDATSDGRKKTASKTEDGGIIEVRTASGGKPHSGTDRSPRRSSLRSGENRGMKLKERRKNSPSSSTVASSESVTESIDLDEPECNDKGSTGNSQPNGNKTRGKGSPGGNMTQESLSLLRGENGRSIQTDVGHNGAKGKGTLTVGVVTESASDATGDSTKGRRREPLTEESEDRESVEKTEHLVILTKEKKKNGKTVSSGSARRSKSREGDKGDQQLGKNQGESSHNLQGASDGISEGDVAPRRNLRSRRRGGKERNVEQVEESKDDLRNGESMVERTPEVEIVDVEELARNYDRTMNSKAGQSSPDIFTMHLENSEDHQKGSDGDSERRKDASQENITGGKNEGEMQPSKSQKQQKRKRKTFAFGTTDMKEDGGSAVNNFGDEVTQKSHDKVELDKQEGEEPQNGGENGQSTAEGHVSATLGASASPDDLPAAPLPGYHHLRRRKKRSVDTVIEGDRPEQSDGNVSVKRTSQRRRQRGQNSGEDTPGTKNKRFCQDVEGVSGKMVEEYSAVSPTPPTVGSTPKLASRKNKEIGLHAKASEEADGSKSLVEAFKEIQSQRTKVGGKESQVGMSMGSPSISLLQGVGSLGQMDLDEMGDAETQEENIKSKVGEVRRDGAEVREGEPPTKQTIEDQSEVEVIEDEAIQEEEEKEVENEEVKNEEDGVRTHTETSNDQKSNSEVRPTDTFRVDDQLDGDEDEEIRPETSHVEENADVTRSEDDLSKLVQDIDELDGEEPLFDDDYASQDSPVGGHHNLTSASSVLSSQSDLMNSQQQENAKETLKKMEQEIAEMERALKEEEDGMGETKKDLDVISDESDTDDESVRGRQDVVDHDKNEHGEVEDDDGIIDGAKDGISKSKDEVEKVCGSTPTSQKGMKTSISEVQTSNLMDRGVSRGKSSGQDLPREAAHEEEDATKTQAHEEKDVAKFKSDKGVRPEARLGRKSGPLKDGEEKTKLWDDDDGDDDVVEQAIDERGRRNRSRNRTLTISKPSNGEKKLQMREKRQGTYSRYKDIESIEDEDIAKNVRENLTEIAAAESSFDSLLKRFSERRRKSEMLSEVEQKTDEDDDDCGSERQIDENARGVSPTGIREPSDSPRSPSPPPVLSQRTLLKRVSPLTENIKEAVRITAKRGPQEKSPGSQKKRRRVVVEESESEDDETGMKEDAEKVETTTNLTPQREERRQTAAVSLSCVPMAEETAQGSAIADRKRKEPEFKDNPGRSGEGTIREPQEKARDQEKVQSPQNIQQTNSSETQQGEQKKKRKRGESMSLIASGLNKQKLKLVEKLCKKAGCRFSNAFSSYTTHVIVNADENLCCERTLKYFQGIAAGKWVISYQWVHDSLSSSRLLPQEKYEIRGDSVNGRNHCGPMRARLWKGPPLLAKFNFFCLEPYTGLSTDQLKGLLTSSGGIVYSHPSELPRGSDRDNLIIAQSGEQEEVDYNALYQKHQTKVISREWVLDSIAIFTAQPVTAYLLCDVPDEGDAELDSDDEF